MVSISCLLLLITLTAIDTRPTTESTHQLLERLGFEKLNKPPLNYHKKRVAVETNKARYSINDYNKDSDSHLFVVKLPPHSPYYSPTIPEKSDKWNNLASKPPLSFRTNGKPATVYHWNIPVLKKMAQSKYRSHHKVQHKGDSKIYNVKITKGDKKVHEYIHENDVDYAKYKKKTEMLKNFRKYDQNESWKHNEQNDEQFNVENTKLHSKEEKDENKMQSDSIGKGTEDYKGTKHRSEVKHHKAHVLSIKELAEQYRKHHKKDHKNHNDVLDTDITNILMHQQKLQHKKSFKKHDSAPSIYSPALPKQNSFYKYFNGNGKPKTFYVIEKSKTPSRFHRLL